MDKFNLEDMNNELSRLLNLQSESYDKQRLGTIIQLRKEIMNIKEQTNKIEIARKVAKKMIEVSMFILISFSMFGQPIFSGKKVHQLPAISTNQFDSTWLTILGNPSTGTLYKLPLDSFTISGYDTSKVTNSRLAKMPLYTVKGNPTNVTADPVDINISGMIQLLGLQSVALTAEYADLLHTPSQFNPIAGANMAVTGSFPNITFTNTLDTSSLSNRINLKLNKSDTSTLSNRINLKANIASPTFTGTVTLPSSTSIGTVSQDEIGFLDGVPDNLVTLLAAKQNTLVSGTNLKTVNGSTLLGTGDITFTAGFAWGNATGNIFNQTDLKDSLALKQKVLVSGTNIKTINGSSLVGSGNLTLITQSPLDSVLLYGNVTNKQYIFTHNSNDDETIIKIDSTIYRSNSGQLVWKAINPDHGISNSVGDFSMSTYWGSKSVVNGLSNFVSMWGYNNSYGGGLVNSNDGSIHIALEGRWDQGGGANYKEMHLPQVNYQKANGSGIEKTLRASTWIFDLNPSNRSADLTFNLTGYHVGILPLAFDSSSVAVSNLDITRGHLAFQSSDNNPYISLLKTGNSVPFTIQLTGSSNNDVTITSQGSLNLQTNNGGLIGLTGFIDNASGSYRITAPSGTTNWGLEINSNSNYGQLYIRNGSAVSMYVTNSSNTIFGDGNNYDSNYKISVDGGAKIFGGIDIESTTKGFLPPRMTTTQRNAISSPSEGLMVYDNTTHLNSVYNGTNWVNSIMSTTGQTINYTMGSIALATDQANNVRIFTPSEYGTNATVGRWQETLGEYQSGQEGNPTARKNVVYSLGYNIDQGISNEGYIRFGIESNYRPGGGIEMFEWHAPEVMTRDGNIKRWYSITGSKATPGATHILRGSTFNFLDIVNDDEIFGFGGSNFIFNGDIVKIGNRVSGRSSFWIQTDGVDLIKTNYVGSGGAVYENYDTAWRYITSPKNNYSGEVWTDKYFSVSSVASTLSIGVNNGAYNVYSVTANAANDGVDITLNGSSRVVSLDNTITPAFSILADGSRGYARIVNFQSNGSLVVGGSSADASSIIDITSTTKGFLPPRHTTTQMNAVSSPATGLAVYNTDATMGLNYNGSAWKSIGVVSGSKTATGTATTTFTVTFGGTQPSTSYYVNITPTNALSAALFYVTNKTTTTFDVEYLAGLTGAVAFDWTLTN